MEHPELQGFQGLCSQCETGWKNFVSEWPPKVIICPACHDIMFLDGYVEEHGATYKRQTKRDNYE